MRANNLSICLPAECNKKCAYCVSAMTPAFEECFTRMHENADKAVRLAKSTGVTSVLITSKGEPTLNDGCLEWIAKFREFPVEIQSNGQMLEGSDACVEWVVNARRLGLNVFALSVDDTNHDAEVLRYAARHLTLRLVVNVSDRSRLRAEDWVDFAKTVKARQLLFRRLTVPIGAEESPQALWIAEHGCDPLYNQYKKWVETQAGSYIRRHNGVQVYDIDGLAVATSDYCVQEKCGADDIRSLIFGADGHMYTGWNSLGSILF